MSTNEFEKGVKFRFDRSVQYAEKAVVSRHVLKKDTGNISLFAFDEGEGLSEHTAPFDALAMIVEGKAEITIDGVTHILEAPEAIVMPANVPHALKAIEKFKMALIMIKSTF